MKAGACSVEITPKGTVFLAGFDFNRRSTGIRDPLYARALYIHDGKTPLVLVSLDLIGYFYPDVLRVRERVKKIAGDNVIVCSTHNHASPDTLGYWGWGLFWPVGFPLTTGRDETYMAEIEDRIASCIETALKNARECRIVFSSDEMPKDISENIRISGKKDDEITIMKAEGMDGKTIAVVANWPCHAETLYEHNREVSADFPGHFYKEIEKALGGVAIFFEGAAGGMITGNLPDEAPLIERIPYTEKIGKVLAEKTLEGLKGGETVESLQIQVKKNILRLPVRNWRFKLARALGILGRDIGSLWNPILETEVCAVSLGPAGIVCIPGELFPSLGFAAKGMMKEKYKFLFTLANDEIAYLMTDEERNDPLYSYERSMSLAAGTGPRILDAVKDLVA